MGRLGRLALVAAGAAAALGAQAVAPRDPAALARALQERYASVRDFSADFVHTYESGALRRRLVERGTLLVKRPGRMRWTYRGPDEKVFVADGSQIFSYLPAERQVIVSPMPAGDEATTAAFFLTGRGDLLRDFTITGVEDPALPAGTVALRLLPRRPQRDYAWLILAVDPATLRIRTLLSQDDQGGQSRFDFSNLKENIGLADKTFEFRIPRGVDVIRPTSPPS